MPDEYALRYREDRRRKHTHMQEYGATAKSLSGTPVRDMFTWCHEQFGPEGERWEWFPQAEHRIGYFGFRDPEDAFAFKMRWG